jgi:hypothetical protein
MTKLECYLIGSDCYKTLKGSIPEKAENLLFHNPYPAKSMWMSRGGELQIWPLTTGFEHVMLLIRSPYTNETLYFPASQRGKEEAPFLPTLEMLCPFSGNIC